MSDIAFLSMLGMIALGIKIGRGSKPLNRELIVWIFFIFLCFYIGAALYRLVRY